MSGEHTTYLVRHGEVGGMEGENEYEVSYTITPGTPESGRFGPPERYDPGSGPEVEIVSFTRDGMAVPEPYPGEIEWIIEQIIDEHDFDADAADDGDRRYEEMRDRRGEGE